MNPLSWLSCSPSYPKFYWENREGSHIIAGFGEASSPSNSFFSWRPFNVRQGEEWAPFSFHEVHPTHQIRFKQDQIAPIPFFPPKKKAEHSLPTYQTWTTQIEKVLAAIQSKDLEKVVLAKRVETEYESPLDPIALFSSLRRAGQMNFFLQLSPTLSFLGSSPERLFKRCGRRIECDALAGTRPLESQEELFTSEKDLHEFDIVQRRIVEALAPLCKSSISISPISLAQTMTVSHLHSCISGHLKDGVDDEALLQALHPTPALGGWPKEKAALWQQQCEPFARGLYGAPIGYQSDEYAEFAVAIRSTLLIGPKSYFYAGTGIVNGSDPALEWEESEQKLMHWKQLLNG